jgi:hypothetical protein
MIKSDLDRSAIATRLLNALPSHLEKQTESYKRIIRYLKHLSLTGERREHDDIIVVSVYLKRSAIFKTLKQAVAKACLANNNSDIKKTCLELMEKFKEIAESMKLQNAKLTMQNASAYQGLIDTHCDEEDEMGAAIRTQRKAFMHQVIGDAEKARVQWQVGKEDQYGDDIEPVDEAFMQHIMTGEAHAFTLEEAAPGKVTRKAEKGMKQFSDVVTPDFIVKVDNALTPEDVCKIMNIPVTTMRVFAAALNPTYDWETLGTNFKNVVRGNPPNPDTFIRNMDQYACS